MRAVVGLCLMLAGCVRPDAHVPPFARLPYEAFSRGTVVAIAQREWRLFGQRVSEGEPLTGQIERDPGLWQRVGEYWWIGLNAGSAESGWTGKHDGMGQVFPPDSDETYAWSAAFVSYVMRLAGAGARFPYAPDHADYINSAKRMALGQAARDWVVTAEAPEAYAPNPGDLICLGRRGAVRLRYADLPAPRFPAHCDIVVGTEPGQIAVIGGNVADGVTMRHVPVTADGKLADPDGTILDPRNQWMTVLRVSG
jgi:hypothetical protein